MLHGIVIVHRVTEEQEKEKRKKKNIDFSIAHSIGLMERETD